MLSKNDFIIMSLDLNLFFLRIMKEHSFFLEIAFGPKDSRLAAETKDFRNEFEKLLCEATELACGCVSRDAVKSNQFVTKYTIDAEKLTNFYTGIPFDTELTRRELMLVPADDCAGVSAHRVEELNRKAYRLTKSLAEFKDKLLQNVLCCRIFTFNYPLLIEHILREARFYMKMLASLCEGRDITDPDKLLSFQIFWNRQMAEHAKFIAGLLDPSEENLIDTARDFGKEFDKLTAEAKRAVHKSCDDDNVTADSIFATKKLQDFKAAGTQGLLECRIRSIIIPLLGDHVLREANYYLCLLGVCNT